MQQVTLFLFGYTGNLAKIKILPALSHFENVKVVGIGRRPVDYPFYIQKDIETQSSEIRSEIDKYSGDKIFYLATYPSLYPKVLALLKGIENAKIMIEKPIAKDLKFNFPEEQIYRVDHYLGKNGLRYLAKDKNENIDYVKILATEDFGIGNRGGFYDDVGALLDVGQNHILQMIAASFGAVMRSQRAEVIKNLVPNPKSLVLGQYEGYRSEIDVDKNSKTDTAFKFSALYQNISIDVFAGKNLDKSRNEVEIRFKDGSMKVYSTNIDKENEYDNLIAEALKGDQTYFVSDEEIKASWGFIDHLSLDKPDPVVYKIGAETI